MSRIKNVIKNAKVGLFFMVITFALGMVSRKIFLDQLGPDFIGLTTTLLGIIGFLSLAEMGLSVAVSSTLYKPLAEKDYQQVCNTIDFLGKSIQGNRAECYCFRFTCCDIFTLLFPRSRC